MRGDSREGTLMNRNLQAMKHGAYAGALATTAMTAVMKAGQWMGFYRLEIAPKQITEHALDKAGLRRETSEDEEILLTALNHGAYGTGSGILFGLLRRRLDLPVPGSIQGIGFALGIWVVSYMGWVPAVGLMPAVWNQRRDRAIELLLAHVVYGATLGFSFDALEHEQ
jgi:hypothetical protein